MERVIARDRVLGHPDHEAALVRVQSGRTHAAMEVHSGEDQRVGAGRRQARLELVAENAEKNVLDTTVSPAAGDSSGGDA